jgi:hypothetical protein
MGGREIRYWNIFGADYLMARRVSIRLVNLSEENPPENLIRIVHYDYWELL